MWQRARSSCPAWRFECTRDHLYGPFRPWSRPLASRLHSKLGYQTLWPVMLTALPIYTLVFASRPFFHLGDEAELIAQLIGFVEDLPLQWRQEWEAIQTRSWYSFPDVYNGANLHQASKLQSRFCELVNDAEQSIQAAYPSVCPDIDRMSCLLA